LICSNNMSIYIDILDCERLCAYTNKQKLEHILYILLDRILMYAIIWVHIPMWPPLGDFRHSFPHACILKVHITTWSMRPSRIWINGWLVTMGHWTVEHGRINGATWWEIKSCTHFIGYKIKMIYGHDLFWYNLDAPTIMKEGSRISKENWLGKYWDVGHAWCGFTTKQQNP
jgi:hypothetical protein